jgi:hypothetical protein
MDQPQTETVEFASPAWLAAITEVLEKVMVGLDTGGRTYTISEEFTDAPEHLKSAHGTIAWHFRVTDDRVEVGTGARREGDLVTTVDYKASLRVARFVYGTSEEAVAQGTKLREAAEATGSRVGDVSVFPAELVARLFSVHNEMALRTR